jgi:chromosome segregation ATPase
VLSKQHSEVTLPKDGKIKIDKELKVSNAQKLIASIEREIETIKSSANSGSIETKLKLEEEVTQLRDKIKEVNSKNKDLQREVNESGKKIESLSNNPEESKELKIILEELRTSKEKLKELETRYQGEKQRNDMIQAKITELDKEAKSLGIDTANLNQPKSSKPKAEEDSKSSKEIESKKAALAELEKTKQALLSSTKKKSIELEDTKNVLSEEVSKLNKQLKDKEYECKQKEYEIKELKRNLRNLQMKSTSVPEINIESNSPQADNKKILKKGKNEDKEEDKPKEIRSNFRHLSMHEEEEKTENRDSLKIENVYESIEKLDD